MTRTMKDIREECAKLGITPARSIEESEKRIAAIKQAADEVLYSGDMPEGTLLDPIKRFHDGVPRTISKAAELAIPYNATVAHHAPKRRVVKKVVSRAIRRKQIAKKTKRQQRAKYQLREHMHKLAKRMHDAGIF